jgi:hypothetical protein
MPLTRRTLQAARINLREHAHGNFSLEWFRPTLALARAALAQEQTADVGDVFKRSLAFGSICA